MITLWIVRVAGWGDWRTWHHRQPTLPDPSRSQRGFDLSSLSIVRSPTVDLLVTETTPAIKGATATNQLKEATLETGLKTRVPPFIEEGELIRVSTADGSYQSRAKE